jgi:hypothetical protein
MKAEAAKWYMPGSVLNALWGNIMSRLAASVWLGRLDWPPKTTPEKHPGGLEAYPVDGTAMPKLAEQIVRIAFTRKANESWKAIEQSFVLAAERQDRLTNAQRSTLITTQYFHPGAAEAYLPHRPPEAHRMPLRVIKARGYDFVLSDQGLDLFVPPKPGAPYGREDWGKVDKKEEPAAREDVLQFYKFRETSEPPIGLPRAPATAFPDNGSPPSDFFVSVPQLTAPTGSHQVPEAWMKGLAPTVSWWLSGSLYRGIMAVLPRIIASKWYEEVAWDPATATTDGYTTAGEDQTYRTRFYKKGGLRELLEEHTETVLPKSLAIVVAGKPSWVPKEAPGWNERDVMITSEGLYIPDPGDAPEWTELAKAIESGVAGNPVFTDTGPCQK